MNDLFAEIDRKVALYELNPQLPEIIELKRYIQKAAANDDLFTLRLMGMQVDSIDPTDYCYRSDDGTFYMQERMFGGVLRWWTIIGYNYPGGEQTLRKQCTRIVVDGQGTYLYNATGDKLVYYPMARCEPNRLNDTGERRANAVAVVNHYTGIEISAEELWQQYSAIVNQQPDGSWSLELNPEPATA